ncbi:MAG: hypothetical protein V4850_18245 [Myxococcota bacterium]
MSSSLHSSAPKLSASSLARAVLGRSAAHILGVHRRVTAWQLAYARLTEGQVARWFELHRVGLEASLRFTEAAAEAVAPRESSAVSTSTAG